MVKSTYISMQIRPDLLGTPMRRIGAEKEDGHTESYPSVGGADTELRTFAVHQLGGRAWMNAFVGKRWKRARGERVRMAVCLLVLLFVPKVGAQGVRNEPLPWYRFHQALSYDSCGCADSCWVATLSDTRTHAKVATLRCDCEAVFFSKSNGKEQVYARTCVAFEGNDKFDHIVQTMEALTR